MYCYIFSFLVLEDFEGKAAVKYTYSVGFFYVYAPFCFKCSTILLLCCSFIHLFWLLFSLQWSRHSFTWCTQNSTVCAQPQRAQVWAVLRNLTFPWSQSLHQHTVYLIPVLKNPAFTTQAYKLSSQSTEESAPPSVQHYTTKWITDLLRIDGAVSNLIMISLGFFKGDFSYMRFCLTNFRI